MQILTKYNIENDIAKNEFVDITNYVSDLLKKRVVMSNKLLSTIKKENDNVEQNIKSVIRDVIMTFIVSSKVEGDPMVQIQRYYCSLNLNPDVDDMEAIGTCLIQNLKDDIVIVFMFAKEFNIGKEDIKGMNNII